MPKFRYIALNADGRQVSGQLEAEGEAAAVRMLSERQLFPVNIASADASRSKRRRVSSRDIGMMYGQLADLIGSGVPMLRALDSLIRSTVHSQLKAILKEVRTAVADGQTLTDALRKVFSNAPERAAAAAAANPMGRNATGEDVAEAIYFLASPAASMITGRELIIDGGDYIKP